MAASLGATVTLALTLALPGAGPAHAQSAPGLFWQCVPVDSTHPQPLYCPVSNQYPLPQGPSINALLSVSGTQTNLSITSATGFTIPTGATLALVNAQGTNGATGICLFWRNDGTAAATNAGQTLVANASMWIKADTVFSMIQASGATCAPTISYYK